MTWYLQGYLYKAQWKHCKYETDMSTNNKLQKNFDLLLCISVFIRIFYRRQRQYPTFFSMTKKSRILSRENSVFWDVVDCCRPRTGSALSRGSLIISNHKTFFGQPDLEIIESPQVYVSTHTFIRHVHFHIDLQSVQSVTFQIHLRSIKIPFSTHHYRDRSFFQLWRKNGLLMEPSYMRWL